MTGEAHWIALIPVLLGGIGIALMFWRNAVEDRRYRVEQRRFLCPDLRQKVVATLVREARSGAVIGVRSCSAFRNPERVVCTKACVPLFGRRRAQLDNAAV